MSRKLAHLRWRGRQWQFARRYPKVLQDRTGKSWLVRNLGTSDTLRAQLIRDRLVVEMSEAAASANNPAVTLSEERLPGFRLERSGASSGYQPAMGNVQRWFEQTNEQHIPIALNLERWISESDVTSITENARRTAISRFCEWAAVQSISKVDRRLAGEYVSHLVSLGYANKTVNGHVAHMNTYWRWMIRRGITDITPWSAQQVKNKNVILREKWEPEEARKIISEAQTKLLLHLAWLGPLTGMRAGEITRLKISDCSGGFFLVRGGKTVSARRRVPIHSKLFSIVDERCSGRAQDELLFPELHENPKNLVKRFSRFLDRVFPGRRVQRQASKTFHSYRHLTIHEMIRWGVAPHIVRQIVGHKESKDMTLGVYYHGFTDEEAREAIERIEL